MIRGHPPAVLRRAAQADAAAVAAIGLAARRAAMPQVRWAHPPAEVRRWIANILIPTHEVWLAEVDGAPAGFLALKEGTLNEAWIDQLYLDPAYWRQGIGSTLVDLAKSRAPSGLRLWCFQVNARARAFYEAHGFVAERLTDGADNEEREPDILYAWQGVRSPPGATPPSGP